MVPVKCPFCDVSLPPAEIAGGWCETCGKRIPSYVTNVAGGTASSALTTDEGGTKAGAVSAALPAPEEVSHPEGSKRAKLAWLGLILAAIFAANAGLAWSLAGTRIWIIVMALVGILAAFGVLGMLKGLVFGSSRPSGQELLFVLFIVAYAGKSSNGVSLRYMKLLFVLFIVAYAGAVLGSGFWISEEFALGTIYVDNFSTQDVVLDLNGKFWRKSARASTDTDSLRRGTYILAVYTLAGAELDRQQIDIDGRGNYILNVLNAQIYSRGQVNYGGPSFGPPPPEIGIQKPWFKADADYLFQDPPESITVRVKRGQDVALGTKTYLRRGAPRARADER